jgi:putative membrane protein
MMGGAPRAERHHHAVSHALNVSSPSSLHAVSACPEAGNDERSYLCFIRRPGFQSLLASVATNFAVPCPLQPQAFHPGPLREEQEMMARTLLAAAALLTAAATAPAALAQSQQQRALGTEAQTGSPPPADRAASPAAGLGAAATRGDAMTAAGFARTAAMSDLYEMEASRLAEQRSQNAQVKQFAQHMIRDHQKTTTELKGMVPQLQGVTASQLPTSLDQQHQTLVQQLQGAQGAEFDRTFARQQVQAHQTAVDLFRSYAQSGDNAQLKQWASRTLPSLEEHLREAQQLQRATQG